MNHETYFYNCLREYLDAVSFTLYGEIKEVVSILPKRLTQADINKDLFWLLTSKGWSFDTLPVGIDDHPPSDLAIERVTLKDIKNNNKRDLCITSTTIEAKRHADFAKTFELTSGPNLCYFATCENK